MAAKTPDTAPTLSQQLAEKQLSLVEAKRGLAAGELANPRVITTTRKEIARLQTALRAERVDEKENK